jgi:antitoxin (DNA-binding transcriptional repressor) of toxin-antitoxin stability system
MKTAGIRELKAHLSTYVKDVERGETVLVTDRGRVVAEIRPPGAAAADATPANLRRQQLIEAGRLRPARTPRSVVFSELPRTRLEKGVTVEELIDAERGE